MNTEVDQAIALLFPRIGRRARDVKFSFTQDGATIYGLARQVIVSFEAMDNDALTISSIDRDPP